jgi:hypothetical protein
MILRDHAPLSFWSAIGRKTGKPLLLIALAPGVCS